MTPRELVEAALIAEGVILFLSLLILFGHAGLAHRRERRWELPLEKGGARCWRWCARGG